MIKTLGIIQFILWLNLAWGQVTPPVLQWQKPLGGTNFDWGKDIQLTPDGSFIVVGTAASGDFDGNTTPFHGEEDVFILKFNAAKELLWRKKFGGSSKDYGVKVKPLATGGCIVLGYTKSPNNGDVSGVHGTPVVSVPEDIWVLRLDDNGNMLWQKCLGGTGIDLPGSIDITLSGGFIVSGYTASNNGDITGNHGGGDTWIIELSATGNILWQKCYGGSGYDGPGYIKTLPAGGYIFTAATGSTNGDVTPNNPEDIWLVSLDATGNILWEKCYGGTAAETPGNVIAVNDGIVVGGTTASSDWSINNHGGTDGWIFKTDFSGNLIWQNAHGGSADERVHDIITAADGGFIMAGGAYFGTPGCDHKGEEDFWIVKTNNTGLFQWQTNRGGTKIDYASGIARAPDGSLFVTGFELSGDREIVGHHSSSNTFQPPREDMWVIILGFTASDLAASVTITSSIEIICEGKPVEFKAHPVNPGSSPAFFWYVNGIGQTDYDDTFITTSLQDGDKVTCKMISQQPCMGDQEVISNEITIRWYPNGRASGFLPPQIIKCINLSETIAPTRPFSNYLWSTGATTPTIKVVNPGLYWLEVSDTTGCSGRENTWVTTKSCMNAVIIPTAFSPNNDGKNDIFKPIVDGKLLQYYFSIYDRWGQLVMQTSDPTKGWDGKRGGVNQESNVYAWICTYQLAGEQPRTERGTVVLIR